MELKNIKEIILYSENIMNNNELISLAKYFGYNSLKDIQCRMDINFINLIKDYLSNEDNIASFKRDVEVKEIDINKKWTIIYNKASVDGGKYIFKENIAYLNSYQQDYNCLNLEV